MRLRRRWRLTLAGLFLHLALSSLNILNTHRHLALILQDLRHPLSTLRLPHLRNPFLRSTASSINGLCRRLSLHPCQCRLTVPTRGNTITISTLRKDLHTLRVRTATSARLATRLSAVPAVYAFTVTRILARSHSSVLMLVVARRSVFAAT